MASNAFLTGSLKSMRLILERGIEGDRLDAEIGVERRKATILTLVVPKKKVCKTPTFNSINALENLIQTADLNNETIQKCHDEGMNCYRRVTDSNRQFIEEFAEFESRGQDLSFHKGCGKKFILNKTTLDSNTNQFSGVCMETGNDITCTSVSVAVYDLFEKLKTKSYQLLHITSIKDQKGDYWTISDGQEEFSKGTLHKAIKSGTGLNTSFEVKMSASFGYGSEEQCQRYSLKEECRILERLHSVEQCNRIITIKEIINIDATEGRDANTILIFPSYKLSVRSYCDSLERKKLPYRQALVYFRDICEGVYHLSKNGILHRNITTDTVMLKDDKRGVVLSGCGLLRSADVSDDPLTDDFSWPDDVFAAGSILYFMIVGKPCSDECAYTVQPFDDLLSDTIIESTHRKLFVTLLEMSLVPRSKRSTALDILRNDELQKITFDKPAEKQDFSSSQSEIISETSSSNGGLSGYLASSARSLVRKFTSSNPIIITKETVDNMQYLDGDGFQ